MGLRESKKAATRAALSWAAIRLTVERGLDNVKIEDIAAAAGVSPRTFNNYFSSKAEAIAARQLDRLLRIADDLRSRPHSEPLWTALAAAALAQHQAGPEVIAHPVPDPPQWTAGLRVMIAEPALQGEMLRAGALAEAELAAAVAERTGLDPTEDFYPHLVAATVMAALNAATVHHLRTDGQATVETTLPEAFTQIAAGLPEPSTAGP
ncbi:TetR/AcrR family transcriptional regulator [Actinoplanes sp. N902-109]|uniref:TetR/AcrR family transcriptional regulator n=1 Tax=Actinoplanes sp. (strain N902-109) TaxID=649831 RepID=UPI0003295FA6|nr:TetR family transcriptional regulator [Actinoplanes sp. N902-109]AGL17960.1 TetR family transcriptional regulator [Actinoplanes sp. N902-109]